MKKRCQVKSSWLGSMHAGIHTLRLAIALTLGMIFLSWSSASFACSVHDHGCIFHSFNSTVQVNPPIVPTNNNALVIYAIGTNGIGGTASAIDFDNKVLLPANTGDKFLVGSPINYNIPTGPYIVSSTSYGAANPPPLWSPAGGAGALQVYPSQYQVIFNQNTAVAKHTGDLNGGENGNIPNATGCLNKPGAANCEAVVVTGNVPNGLYEQKVRIFNFQNTPNPQVDIQYGAYVTGQLAIVNASHETNATASFSHLSGNGDITPTAVYEVYNRGFNPHASGTAWFDRSKSRISGYSNPYQQGTHVYQDKFFTNTLTRTTVQGNGDSRQHSANTHGVTKMDLGVYVPPAPVLDPHPMFTAFMQERNQFASPQTPAFEGINLGIVFPKSPAGLPDGWRRDPTHKDPNGERWRSPSGDDFADWNPKTPGASEKTYEGQDHWHWNGEKWHYLPGSESPDTTAKIAIGVGAAGLGYLIYRGVRLVPSVVIPPLWPSIFPNLAIP